MSTTVAIKKDTYFMLSQMKEELKASNFDDTIKKMIGKLKIPKKSLFGAFPGVGEFKRTDQIDRFD